MVTKHEKLYDEFRSLCNHEGECAFCPRGKACRSLVSEIFAEDDFIIESETAMQNNLDTLTNLIEGT